MIKSVFAATAALSMSAGAAFAGPYVNVEANSGWTGSNYNGTATDLHVGYEGALGENASYYVQGGATVVSPDGGESDTVPSGKAGLGFAVTDDWVHMVKFPLLVLETKILTVVMVLSWVSSTASDKPC